MNRWMIWWIAESTLVPESRLDPKTSRLRLCSDHFIHGKQARKCCHQRYRCWLMTWDTSQLLCLDRGPHPTSAAKGGPAGCVGTSTVGGTGRVAAVSTSAGGELWKFVKPGTGKSRLGSREIQPQTCGCFFHIFLLRS